ncbi:MAG TPA: SCO family protein, partial [Planctomycetota bacterium]|nr:SCO family protein [Planctomycetota bacterium]
LAAPAAAQLNVENEVLREVGVTQRVGDSVPLDLQFTDQDGRVVALGDYFVAGRPVLLTLNYSNCPALCIAQLDLLVETLNAVELAPAEDFLVLTVSVDPHEPPARAKQSQELYAGRWTREDALAGWQFLVGAQPSIDRLADAVGFAYRLVPETGEYAHEAVAILIGDGGVINRYFGGLEYDPQTIRYSVVEASAGELGGLTDFLFLSCYAYDPNAGGYAIEARKLMTAAGAVTVVVLGGFLLFLWRREILAALRRRRAHAPSTGGVPR